MEVVAPHIDPLIAEARRRARRRRWAVALAALVLAAAATFAVRRAGGAAAPALDPARGQLTIVRDGIRNVGGGKGGADLWPCGPQHQCWEVESLAWAPGGTRFAFGGVSLGGAGMYDGLHVVDLARGTTSIIRRLTPTERDWLDLAWSPDGKQLAYVTHWTISIVAADGSSVRALETGTEGHDRSPTWSPDGTRIAYQTTVGREARVYVVRLADGYRSVVARNATFPAWSPDGRTIAYRACGGVRLARPGGLDVTPASGRCAHIGVDGAPAWSPDGRQIAMGLWKVGTFAMNADGKALTKVGPAPSSIAQPEVREAWLRPAWRPAPAAGLAYDARQFPIGTYRTKITTTDLYRAGLDTNDAHWDTLTLRADGTWRDVWSHPSVADQPPASGRYVVHGGTIRFLGTPDTVTWSYGNGLLTFHVVHVPDKLARLGYTAHPWRKIR